MSFRVSQDTQFAGLKALAKRFQGPRGVLVGVPAGKTEEDGTSLAVVAASNEFGVPEKNIPERPAFRGGIRNNADQLARVGRLGLIRIAEGQASMESQLNLLGEAGAGAIKREMVSGEFAPNAPATIKRKGSDRPWIDTGQVRQSITHEIDNGEEGAGIVR